MLLKPNLVEYISGAEVNTPHDIGAAAEAFLALGARAWSSPKDRATNAIRARA